MSKELAMVPEGGLDLNALSDAELCNLAARLEDRSDNARWQAAEVYAYLNDKKHGRGMSTRAIAERVDRSPTHISRMIRVWDQFGVPYMAQELGRTFSDCENELANPPKTKQIEQKPKSEPEPEPPIILEPGDGGVLVPQVPEQPAPKPSSPSPLPPSAPPSEPQDPAEKRMFRRDYRELADYLARYLSTKYTEAEFRELAQMLHDFANKMEGK